MMINRLSAPLFVQLELTEGCTHSCGYCSNPFRDERRVKKPSVDKISSRLEKIIRNKIFSVVLTGGEPFQNRSALHYCLDRLFDLPIEVYVNTNLSHALDDADILKLKTTDYVLVSFPSSNEERFNRIVKANSFRKVVSNLELLSKEGIHFGINQVVTPENYADVEDTFEFLRKRFCIKEYSASPVIPTNRTSLQEYAISDDAILNLARRLIDLERRTGVKTDMLTFIPPCYFPEEIALHRIASHGCSAGRDSAIISANGEVRRCALMEDSYGNLDKEQLSDIWGRIIKEQKPINHYCKSCMPHEYCFGGCEARAFACGGQDPYIKMLSGKRKKELYKTPNESDKLTVGRILWREEEDKYLIGNGGSYVVGNESLINFLRQLEGRIFTYGEVKSELGEAGSKLVKYLFNRGLIRQCNLE